MLICKLTQTPLRRRFVIAHHGVSVFGFHVDMPCGVGGNRCFGDGSPKYEAMKR